MTGDDSLIGEGAADAPEPRRFTDGFRRVAEMARVFELAEEAATAETPLVNAFYNLGATFMEAPAGKDKILMFSDIELSKRHRLALALGQGGRGFYQLPIIEISHDKELDFMFSGSINNDGEATRFSEPCSLRDLMMGRYELESANAQKLFGVVLVPDTDVIGNHLMIAGGSVQTHGQIAYQLGTNGFLSDRAIVATQPRSQYPGSLRDALGARPVAYAPFMFPRPDGSEEYMTVEKMLSPDELATLEGEGIFPGLTFIAGKFEETPRIMIDIPPGGLASELSREAFGGGSAMKSFSGVGRAGVGTSGIDSGVRYGSIRGRRSSIDGIAGLYFLRVGPDVSVGQLQDEIGRYTF